MIAIRAQRTLAHSAETVWGVLSDFGNIGWAAGDNTVEIIGEGVGMIRRIIVDGLDEPIDEVMDGLDQAHRQVSYSIPRGMPFPVENYRASATVNALADDESEVIWQGHFTAKAGVSDEDAKVLLEATYEQLIDWLSAHLDSTK